MATETIREFLISLSYKQDAAALKKFEEGITKATKAVFALAAAVEATAITVAAGIAKWSSSLESLYFAAQRTGTSATRLRALDAAAQDLGANAGEATQAVESLAGALRTNPGNIGLLQGLLARLGMTLKVNADGSIDAADALLKLSEVFKRMPFFQANQFAQQLGISEHLLYQLTHGDLVGGFNKKLVELSRGGLDQAADHAHAFMMQLRALGLQLESFGVQVVDAIQQKLGINLENVRKWLQQNGPQLAQRVADVAKQLIDAAQYIGGKVGWLIGKLKEWDEETGGLSTKLIALAVLLKVSGAGSLIGGVLALAGAFGTLASAMAPVVAGLTAIYAIHKLWSSATEDQNLAPGQIPNIVKFKRWMNNLLPQKNQIPRGILENNPGNLEFRNQPGAARDGRFAIFPSEGEGLFQLARQLELYAGRGINTVQGIISRWAPPGENNTAAYIADVARRLGSSPNQALNFNDPTVVANMMRAITLHEQGYNPYSPSLLQHEASRAIAGGITQNNTVNVNGATDPEAVGRKVQDVLKKNNADLARNFANAVN